MEEQYIPSTRQTLQVDATIKAYVFLIQREIDAEPWPTVFRDLRLAVDCPGRVSQIMIVELVKGRE